MIAMPPTAITVAELPVEPEALQAFALEQNRLACVLWEQLEALQHQIAQANRARFGVSSERLMGQAELFDAATELPIPPAPAQVPVAGCHGSAYWSHSGIGVMEPPDDRRSRASA